MLNKTKYIVLIVFLIGAFFVPVASASQVTSSDVVFVPASTSSSTYTVSSVASIFGVETSYVKNERLYFHTSSSGSTTTHYSYYYNYHHLASGGYDYYSLTDASLPDNYYCHLPISTCQIVVQRDPTDSDLSSVLSSTIAYINSKIPSSEYYIVVASALIQGIGIRVFCQVYIPSTQSSVVPAVSQHVTVTYSDSTDKYTVSVARNGIDTSVGPYGKLFGWLSVTTPYNNQGTSDITFTLPAHGFMGFAYDYDLWITYNYHDLNPLNHVIKHVTWNYDMINGGTPPPLISYTPTPTPTARPTLNPSPTPFPTNAPFVPVVPTINLDDFKLPDLFDMENLSLPKVRDDLSVNVTSLWYDFQQGGFDGLEDWFDSVYEMLTWVTTLLMSPFLAFLDMLTTVYNFLASSILSFDSYTSFPRYIMNKFISIVPAVIVNIALTALVLVISLKIFKYIIPVLGGVVDIGIGVGRGVFDTAKSGISTIRSSFSGSKSQPSTSHSVKSSGSYSSWRKKESMNKSPSGSQGKVNYSTRSPSHYESINRGGK